MGNSPFIFVDPNGEFVGTALTFLVDLHKTLFFEGGWDFWNYNDDYVQDAWRNFDPGRTGTKTNNAWKIDMGLFQTDDNRTLAGRFIQLFSRFTWEIPQTSLGYLTSHGANLSGNVNDVNYFAGATVLDTDFKGGAFTLGSYILGPKGFKPDFRDHLFVHEYGHYLQNQRLGLLYLPFVALPSVTDFYLVGTDLHDTRWYETNASKRAANYFDKHYGSGRSDYFEGSPDHFDRSSFENEGQESTYINPRNRGRNRDGNPTVCKFHWTDIPINVGFNLGIGLFGYTNCK